MIAVQVVDSGTKRCCFRFKIILDALPKSRFFLSNFSSSSCPFLKDVERFYPGNSSLMRKRFYQLETRAARC